MIPLHGRKVGDILIEIPGPVVNKNYKLPTSAQRIDKNNTGIELPTLIIPQFIVQVFGHGKVRFEYTTKYDNAINPLAGPRRIAKDWKRIKKVDDTNFTPTDPGPPVVPGSYSSGYTPIAKGNLGDGDGTGTDIENLSSVNEEVKLSVIDNTTSNTETFAPDTINTGFSAFRCILVDITGLGTKFTDIHNPSTVKRELQYENEGWVNIKCEWPKF